MVLKEPILKILGKTYEPLKMVELKFGRYDLAIKTDELGRAILLFLGNKDPLTGKIKGERFARRLVTDKSGKLLKIIGTIRERLTRNCETHEMIYQKYP